MPTASATAVNTPSATASSTRSSLNVLYGGRKNTSSVPAATPAVITAAVRPPAHAATTTGTTSASAALAVLLRALKGMSSAAVPATSPTPTSVAPTRPSGRPEMLTLGF